MCEVNVDSPRVKRALALMAKGTVPFDKLKITETEIEELKRYGVKIEYEEETFSYYINTSEGDNFVKLSVRTKKPVIEKWIELSDLWIGNKFFDEQTLRYVLRKAEDEGYTNVFISGNITFGHPKYLSNNLWINKEYKTSLKQAEYAMSIFKDFPTLKYYAIHGPRDKSFEIRGEINPLLFLSKDLKDLGIEFNYIENYTANVLIRGGIKRMVCLPKYKSTYTKSYPVDLYIRQQLSNIGGNTILNGVNYKIRCLQIGNVLFDSYAYTSKMYCTTSGGFVFDTEGAMQIATSIPAAMFCSVNIKDTKIQVFHAKIVRYPREIKRI